MMVLFVVFAEEFFPQRGLPRQRQKLTCVVQRIPKSSALIGLEVAMAIHSRDRSYAWQGSS
jgi:hypothetical protein